MALQRVETDAIQDDAVTTAKIAANAVAAADIAADAITNVKVAAGAAIAVAKISGLGTAATLTAGTAANNVVQLDGSARLPAVSGANLTGVSTDTSAMENNIAILAFKTQSANNLAKFNLIDQVIDEYYDTSGIDAGNSTNEAVGGSGVAKYYEGQSGSASNTVTFAYTGADVNWTVPNTSTATIIAWGAGGGGSSGVGGGGGFISGDISVTAAETLVVKVGGAGVFNTGTNYSGVGNGGGGTGIYRSGTVLAIAGAGGGAASSHNGGAGGGTTGGAGAGSYAGSGGTQSAGGAGGAAAGGRPAGNAGSLNQGGHGVLGGSAITMPAAYNGGGTAGGDLVNYTTTGGGGGYYGGGSGGSGANGSGGGGSSLTAGTNTQATTRTPAQTSHANYPGGYVGYGGAASTSGYAGFMAITYSAPNTGADLTLQSVANTALSAPTTGDVVMLIENAQGTATLNTDIKAWVSRNGGTGWDQATLVDKGTWGSGTKKIVSANNVAFSNSASGTDMRYKITTHNQSAGSKETRVHATSLAWA